MHAAPTFALLSPTPMRTGTWFPQTRYLFTPLLDHFADLFHELHGLRVAFEPERSLVNAPLSSTTFAEKTPSDRPNKLTEPAAVGISAAHLL